MLKILMFYLFLIMMSYMCSWKIIIYMLMMSMIFMILNLNENNYLNFLSYEFGLDILSWGLIMLSVWISFLMLMSSKSIFRSNYYKKYFVMNILLLLFILCLVFSTSSLMMFYLYFESSLIPTLLLIMGWGYQPERIEAGLYMLLYTLLASLPLLICIFYIMNKNMSYIFYEMNLNGSKEYLFIYLGLMLAFMVKLPVVYLHFWLPKAHVEAPVSGSMILAGVLLKLGGYGMIRISKMLLLMYNMNLYFILMAMVGCSFISILCLCQSDMKSLIAYSSVVHMSLMFSGIMTGYMWALNGSYLMMISHGLCSSGLFSMSNMFYERSGSRNLIINCSMFMFLPFMMFWWFMLCIFNGAAPPSLNLWSEIMMFCSLINWNNLMILMIMIISFFSVCYSLYLFSFIFHMKNYLGLNVNDSGYMIEYLNNFLHLLPLIIMSLNLDYMCIWL